MEMWKFVIILQNMLVCLAALSYSRAPLNNVYNIECLMFHFNQTFSKAKHTNIILKKVSYKIDLFTETF